MGKTTVALAWIKAAPGVTVFSITITCIFIASVYIQTSLMAQQVRNPPARQKTQETRVQCLGWEDWPTLGEGNSNLLQYSCLKNSMDRRVTKSWTWLCDWSQHIHIETYILLYIYEFYFIYKNIYISLTLKYPWWSYRNHLLFSLWVGSNLWHHGV